MAAPSYAYTGYKIALQSTGGQVDHYLAKIHIDEETHLELFYLDEIIALGNSTEEGWAGVVYPSSPNYQYHNILRHGTMRHQGSGVVLNDGGLNTLAPISLGSAGFVTLFANYIRANINVKSAYYLDTTSFGFEFKKPSASSWTRVSLASLLANDSLDDVFRLPAGFEPETDYQIRFYNENDEGVFISAPFTTITTDVFIIEEEFQQRTVACTPTATQVTLFMPTETRAAMSSLTNTPVTGADLFAWISADFDTPPAQGWYYSGDDGYSYFYNSTDGFTHRSLCDVVPTIKVNLNVTIFASGYWTATALNITGTNFTSDVTITALAVGELGGMPIENIPISVTIPANTSSGMNSGSHSADFVNLLDWSLGGFESDNHSFVLDNEINGLVGIGS